MSPKNITQVNIKIEGKVQGVYFRFYTQEKAEELGLTGWVKNLDDGRVEILAQGEDNKIIEFIDWCHLGSPNSKVKKVESNLIESTEEFETFSILR